MSESSTTLYMERDCYGEISFYQVDADGEKLTLRHWENDPTIMSEFRGKKIGTLKDMGNDIVLKINGKKLKLDYAEIQEVYLLITAYHDHDPATQINILKFKEE